MVGGVVVFCAPSQFGWSDGAARRTDARVVSLVRARERPETTN